MFVALWSMGILIVFFLAVDQRKQQIEENEKITAKMSYEKDLVYRAWIANYGGVYVPISKVDQPNPYLKFVPNREIYTLTGDTFTLINPAFMSRQIYTIEKTHSVIFSRLVSSKPLNPLNYPDKFETEALRLFSLGSTEYIHLDTIRGKEYFRYVKPFITEQSCLKCHQQQGYKVGDVRGALSIFLPTDTFESIFRKSVFSTFINYFVIWILGMIIILLIIRRLSISLKEIENANETIQLQNSSLLSKNSELLVLSHQLDEHINSIQNLNEHLSLQNSSLDELNATKDKFFSIIAHDLKNPFNVLLGLSELLQRSSHAISADDLKRIADSMNSSSRHAYLLLYNLLEWSSLQTGRLQPRPEKVFPSVLISHATEANESMALAKCIQLQVKVTCNDYLFVDAEMIKTVIRNLLNNAVKFTHRNGLVHVETMDFDDYILFSFIDSGVGMDSEHVAKLFRIDAKLSTKGTENESGTGLGLILVNEFIAKNGGKIWVESQPGKGSTFKFILPKWKP